jgi:hypothetical protein
MRLVACIMRTVIIVRMRMQRNEAIEHHVREEADAVQ